MQQFTYLQIEINCERAGNSFWIVAFFYVDNWRIIEICVIFTIIYTFNSTCGNWTTFAKWLLWLTQKNFFLWSTLKSLNIGHCKHIHTAQSCGGNSFSGLTISLNMQICRYTWLWPYWFKPPKASNGFWFYFIFHVDFFLSSTKPELSWQPIKISF